MSVASIMQANPQPWTIASILNRGYGKVLLADTERACLQIGCFYFIEGPFTISFAQQWVAQLTKPAIVISSNPLWYEYCLQHTNIGLQTTKRCLYLWNQQTRDLAQYFELQQPEYRLSIMDAQACQQILQLPWAEGVFDSYANYSNFLQQGFGFCIYHADKIISLCMSFAESEQGVEIEVDTDPDYQGQGLAKVVAANFIAEAIERSLTPLWDASNPASAKIAAALGFNKGKDYLALSTF